MADYQELLLNERLRLHTTVFGLAFSSCGKYLAACNNFGKISIFSIPLALAPEASAENYKPIASFEAHSGPIYCLISTENFLISGGSSEICGWRWKELLQKSPSPAWTLTPPSSNPLDQPETNALAYNKEDNLLFSGCGDSNIYVWDLESGACKKSIKGHSDYIHSLAIRPRSGQCVSGSEDGTVRLWDLRSPAAMIHKIEPHKNEELNRPAFGKWIGCVGVDESEDWLVCGGGPSLSVWRLNSMSCTGVLETPNSCQQVAIFHDDSIISGGSEPFVFHWTINGDLKSRVPCTPSSVYAIEVNTKSAEHKVLGLGGTSSMIDMFTNFGYKAFSFEFN